MKPHKCPVCLGMCEILDERATYVVMVSTIPCPACFGSGIVWEPEFSHPVRDPKKRECEGNCGDNGHIGIVRRVRVIDEHKPYDWGEFWYCEFAIQEDRDREFIVEILHDQT